MRTMLMPGVYDLSALPFPQWDDESAGAVLIVSHTTDAFVLSQRYFDDRNGEGTETSTITVYGFADGKLSVYDSREFATEDCGDFDPVEKEATACYQYNLRRILTEGTYDLGRVE